MAEKIFNTRILNKIDTLENWNKSTLKIKKGEICFATVAASAGTGLTEPVVMVKVGTEEEKTFAELPWAFYAKASDVLAACKTEEGLTAFINGVISKAGIATDAAMKELAGKVTAAEGEIDALQAALDTEGTGLKARMTAVEGDIDALETKVGEKTVAAQIQEAIDALATVYAAKSLESTVDTHIKNTDIHVTTADKTKWNGALQASDIAAGSANGTVAVKGTDVAITGLGSAAFTEASAYDAAGAAGTAEDNAKKYAKDYADGLAKNYDAAGTAASAASAAETAAKTYADGLAKNYDASGSAAQALADAKDYTDEQLTAKVGDKTVAVQIQEKIDGLKLAETYAAKGHKHTKADITDFAHTHEMTEINGLGDALAGKETAGAAAQALQDAKDYADGKDEAIEAAQAAADKAQDEVDALETYVGTIPETYTETNVIAYINKKAQETLAAASGNSTETAASVKQQLDDYIGENDTRVGNVEKSVDDLEALVGTTAVATQISEAVKAEEERAKAAEKVNADAIAVLNGDANKVGSVDYKVAQEVAKILNDNDASDIDTLNEIAAWIKNDTAGVGALNKAVTDNANAIDEIEKDYLKAADKEELTGAINGVAADLETLEGEVAKKALASDLTALDGRVATVESDLNTAETGLKAKVAAAEADIDALEGLVGTTAVSAQITTAVNELKNGQLKTMQDEIDAVEAKKHEHTNKAELDKFVDGDKAKLDAAVQTVTAGTGLTATKTGTDVTIAFDDTVTFIFDCGGSGVVAE